MTTPLSQPDPDDRRDEVPPTEAWPPGYERVARLDQEPYCVAWEARAIATGNRVCLKMDPAHPPRDQGNEVHQEGKVLRRLQACQAVPRLIEEGECASRPYIVTELVEGSCLESITRPVTLETVCRIGARIARALAEVHRAGVVWRDLKPRNIWNPLGELRFQKFDIAVGPDDLDRERQELRSEVAGTPHYMAPEQWQGRATTPAMDCYALGVVLYEVLTGEPPFSGVAVMDVMKSALNDPPPDVRGKRPDLPEPFAQLISALLAKQPADRPANLDAVACQLDQLANPTVRPVPPPAEHSQTPPTVPPPSPPAEPADVNLNLLQDAAEIQTGMVFQAAPPPPPPAPAVREPAEGQTFGSISIAAAPKGGAPRDAESFHRSIREGTPLGPYKVRAPIGAGSFGWVYLAEDTGSMLGRQVALKIPTSQSLTPEELARYQHEAKLWRALSLERHANVLELYDLNRFDGVIAFVMEYVEGSDLRQFAMNAWQQGPFPLADAARIIAAVAEALKVIHAKRVYHGDLKPSNVLIRRDDRAVKVSDFSVSRSVSPEGSVRARFVGGTPAYMAPEVWEGKPCLQSDIFALGIMFHELVTGARPFQGGDQRTLAAAIRDGQKEPPSRRRPDLPFALERVILRCLEPAVEDRYASVSELLEDLYEADTSQDLVTRLAECVMAHSAPEDLDFLVENDLPARGYRGDRQTLVLEYCLDEDPSRVLLSCFSKAGLARLAKRLGAPVEEKGAEAEQYAEAILAQLGLAGGGKPHGVQESIAFVSNLRHRLEHCQVAAEVTGFVTPGAREYEKVLRDLVRFYGQVLFGRFYERSLVRLARNRVAGYKRDLSRATLGELIGIVQALNEHVAGDSAEAQHFRKVFRRSYAVPPDHLNNSRVTAVRNAFVHWNDTFVGASLARVRDAARDMLTEIVEFLQRIEEADIYPRIVVVESFVTDRFGRKYVTCRSDQGKVEKVFTSVAVDPSRHYFFYPTTNPIRIYPILVPA